MIVGTAAHWLNLLSLSALLGFAVITLQSLTGPVFLRAIRRLAPAEQKWILLGWACMPWALTALVLLQGMALTPDAFGVAEGLLGSLHWHHADVFEFTGWHGWILSTAALWLSLRCGQFLFKHWRLMSQIRLLLSETVAGQNDGFRVLPTREAVAMTTGFVHSRILLSQGLLEQTSQNQQSVILAHEQAHLRARDNLLRLLLTLMTAVLPDLAAKPLISRFSLVTEQLADAAVKQHHDAASIAQTLVQVARLRHAQTLPGQAAFIARQQLTERVYELLEPTRPSRGLQLLVLLALLLMALSALSAMDALHHLFDLFLIHS